MSEAAEVQALEEKFRKVNEEVGRTRSFESAQIPGSPSTSSLRHLRCLHRPLLSERT